MAKQTGNIIMRHARGMIGGQLVFKRRAGNGYIAAAPVVKKDRQPTLRQKAVQDKFKICVGYAKLAIAEPVLKMAYELKAARNQSAFNVAFRDAQYAPKVQSLLTYDYTGAIGSVIVARATDDFKVNSVKISIRNANDELIEEGPAAQNAQGLWTYSVTQSNPNICGTKIKASAYDIPGNEGSLEVTL